MIDDTHWILLGASEILGITHSLQLAILRASDLFKQLVKTWPFSKVNRDLQLVGDQVRSRSGYIVALKLTYPLKMDGWNTSFI